MKVGEYKFQCDRCGGIYYSKNRAIEWNGAVVCKGAGTRDCWEPRQPLDFVRAMDEDIAVENARPINRVAVSDLYPNGVTADDL